MSGLWKNQDGTREGKYLVTRRDGTVPEWPSFVIGARDPCGPAALLAYANAAEEWGFHRDFVADVRGLAREFMFYRRDHGDGDPDAPPHRKDDPATIEKMRTGKGS